MGFDAQSHDWSDVAVAMDRGLRAFSDFVRPILVDHDASALSVGNLIFLLSIGDGHARINDVVRRGRYIGSNASYALRALQDGGLIARERDPRDRRNGIVAWTEKGRAVSLAVMGACRSEAFDIPDALRALRGFERHCATSPDEG